jgi:voltage-gated potassium channel
MASSPLQQIRSGRDVLMSRELVVANLFLSLVLVVGTLGYMLLEGWTVMDSLYMTFITLTTIGFKEVHELSGPGRFFTIVIGLAGIGSVAFIATRTAQVLLNTRAFRTRTMLRSLDAMKDHYILAGYGRIGQRIAKDLKRHDVPFVIIEAKDSKMEELERFGYRFLIGNAENEEIQVAAGIERAKGLILTLPEDRANVFATLVAREVNPDLFIMVRTDTNANRRKLIRAGADKVVAPYEIGADRMAQVLLRPSVERFMERVLQADALAYTMDEVLVEEGAELAGKTLQQSNFRQQFDAIVVAVMDGRTLSMSFNPGPQQIIQAGDTLIVMGSVEMIARLKKDGCTAQST